MSRSRKLIWGITTSLAVLASACSSGEESAASEPQSRTEELRQRASDALTGQGITFKDLAVEEERWDVIVDKDMVIPLDSLIGSQSEFLANRLELKPEGYNLACLVSHGARVCNNNLPIATRVTLKFDANISTAWRTAFLQAASQWSAANCIEIVTSGGSAYEFIQVSLADLGDSNIYADGKFPYVKSVGAHLAFVTVGDLIRLNTSFAGGIENLVPTLKTQVALHEMGHTLGYVHPENAYPTTQVPGSQSGTGYATVMHSNFGGPGISALTSDDVVSRNALYGEATCPASPP